MRRSPAGTPALGGGCVASRTLPPNGERRRTEPCQAAVESRPRCGKVRLGDAAVSRRAPIHIRQSRRPASTHDANARDPRTHGLTYARVCASVLGGRRVRAAPRRPPSCDGELGRTAMPARANPGVPADPDRLRHRPVPNLAEALGRLGCGECEHAMPQGECRRFRKLRIAAAASSRALFVKAGQAMLPRRNKKCTMATPLNRRGRGSSWPRRVTAHALSGSDDARSSCWSMLVDVGDCRSDAPRGGPTSGGRTA